jgi:hypothetical protein
MDQKLDLANWKLVVWDRMLVQNAAGVLGVTLLVLPRVLQKGDRRIARLSLLALGLFVLPIAIFTNLHVVHEYYQISCLVFLLMALGIVVSAWLPEVAGFKAIAPVLAVVLAGCNVWNYNAALGTIPSRPFENLDSRSVAIYKVAKVVSETIPDGSAVVVFGVGYSSEFAFHSGRKTMAVPEWFKDYRSVWTNPNSFLGGLKLGAIVYCPASIKYPTQQDVADWLASDTRRRAQAMELCTILYPADTAP